MTIHKKGQAHWEGGIKRGKGTVSTESGVLNQQPYGFNTRFEGAQGDQPGRVNWRRTCGLFLHGTITHAGRGWIYADIH